MTDEWSAAFRSFLSARELSDEALEETMIGELDRALGHPQRRTVPAGTILMRAGDPVDEIRIVLDGSVRLTLPVGHQETTFHSRTAGRIIGSMSIPYGSPSFFTVAAKTELTFIEVTVAELDEALERNPQLTAYFVTVLLRSMARRNRRSAELQTLVRELVAKLADERDLLRGALDELRRTQGRLVEAEKLATLGQLAAGIGHELNNPAAAISRAADHVLTDAESIALHQPQGQELAAMLRAGYEQARRRTADERAARRELAAAIGDDALARRLVRIGITTEADYRHAVEGAPDPLVRVTELEHHFRLGASLRTIGLSAERIAALVRSVKVYARPDTRWANDVDVNEGIEESLLLLGHELHDVTVERNYGELPPVTGAPGELNQVWTNLFTNALEAMGHSGTLRIETTAPTDDTVEIRVIDSGHGIPEDDLERIFEPSFTTREGHVEFGLGLGLQICRDIVTRHSGTIDVTSRPGRTCFAVTLPVLGGTPPDAPDQREGDAI
jgi:signal transduction histidine kinase